MAEVFSSLTCIERVPIQTMKRCAAGLGGIIAAVAIGIIGIVMFIVGIATDQPALSIFAATAAAAGGASVAAAWAATQRASK